MGLPSFLGRYRIEERLAEGGMGEIYRASEQLPSGLERPVALKVLRPEQEAEPIAREMFQAEARIALWLSHTNVVRALEAGRDGGHSFLAMELVDGVDLAWLCHTARSRGEMLPLGHAAHIAVEALRGLDYAHRSCGPSGQALHVVHRDVSPSNIVVARSGDVKLLDFGVALSAVRESRSIAGTLKGKVLYMAPEQLRGEALDARADVYGLGAVLYEMLTGQRPFPSSGFEIIPHVLSGRFPPPSSVRPELPDELEEIVLCAMSKQPEGRYTSAAAMATALELACERLGIERSAAELGAFVDESRAAAIAAATAPRTATIAARPSRLRQESA